MLNWLSGVLADNVHFLAANWWWFVPLVLIASWLAEAAKRNKDARWVRLWGVFIRGVSYLFLLIVIFGIFAAWRDWGFSTNSLLYGLLILVLAGLFVILERLNSVHQNLRALRAEFETMFGREVERRRNPPADSVIYVPGQKQ
jgi:hypothetical protein